MKIPQETPAIIHVISRRRRVPKIRFIRALNPIFGEVPNLVRDSATEGTDLTPFKKLSSYQIEKLSKVVSNDIPNSKSNKLSRRVNPIVRAKDLLQQYEQISNTPTGITPAIASLMHELVEIAESCAYTRVINERVGALIAYNTQVDGKKVTMVGYSLVHAKDRGKFSVSTAIENGVKNAVPLEVFFHKDFFADRNIVSRVLLAEIPQFRKRVERYFRLNITNNADGSVVIVHRVETPCIIPAV